MSEFILIMLAVWCANLIHGLIFTLLKANKYEDTLADKIAKKTSAEVERVLNVKELGK